MANDDTDSVIKRGDMSKDVPCYRSKIQITTADMVLGPRVSKRHFGIHSQIQDFPLDWAEIVIS
jgi:hypothetical protein